jgi:hypothetical protein
VGCQDTSLPPCLESLELTEGVQEEERPGDSKAHGVAVSPSVHPPLVFRCKCPSQSLEAELGCAADLACWLCIQNCSSRGCGFPRWCHTAG